MATLYKRRNISFSRANKSLCELLFKMQNLKIGFERPLD